MLIFFNFTVSYGHLMQTKSNKTQPKQTNYDNQSLESVRSLCKKPDTTQENARLVARGAG